MSLLKSIGRWPENYFSHSSHLKGFMHLFVLSTQETFSTHYTSKKHFPHSTHENACFLFETYQCKYCDHKASAPKSLSTHIKSVHKGFTHDCQVCDYKTKYKHNPEQHIKTAHTKVEHKCDQCD